MFRSLCRSLLLAGAACALPALASAHPPGARYRQSPAVLALYGDVPVALDAPALRPGKSGFTTQAELEAHLSKLAGRSPRMQLRSLGRSAQGRDLPYAVFTAEGLAEPEAILMLERPVVWLIGGQHGNEPAGGEALLAVASALADGELTPLLARVTVVVVPRANPDGAAGGQRRTSAGLDLNRDHLLASQPETRALQAAAAALPPDLVIDFHEYAAAGPWLARFGVLAPWDAMFLQTTHPAAPSGPVRLAETAFRPAMERRLAKVGLSSHTFLAASAAEADQGVIPTGGAAPGISRNYFGLTGAVSMLVETRGGDTGREAFQRRVATHYLSAAAALETAAREGARLTRTVAEARRSLANGTGPVALEHAIAGRPETLNFIDSLTGRPEPLRLELRDSRDAVITRSRSRPAGYLLLPEAEGALAALRVKGVRTCSAGRARLAVETYRVRSLAPGVREEINPEGAARVDVEPDALSPGKGAVYVPMDQAGAAIIAAALEPDSAGSHLAAGLVPVSRDGRAPIYRVLPGPAAARLCGEGDLAE